MATGIGCVRGSGWEDGGRLRQKRMLPSLSSPSLLEGPMSLHRQQRDPVSQELVCMRDPRHSSSHPQCAVASRHGSPRCL